MSLQTFSPPTEHHHHHSFEPKPDKVLRALMIAAVLLLLWLCLEGHGWAQGSGGAVQDTYDPTNHALKVNVVAGGGTGGGPSDAAANAAASETDTARQKVTSVLRLFDTSQIAGSQLVSAKGDQTSGLWVNCKSGCSAAGDAVGSTSPLNAGNATATVALSGAGGVGVLIAAGTLAATVTPEVSYDGGTTWLATLFYDPSTQATAANKVFTNPNSAIQLTILVAGGASNARVRVSAFTSGTANATLRATANAGSLTVTQGGAPWGFNLSQVGGASITLGSKTSANSFPVVIASDQGAIPVSQNGTWTVQQGGAPWSVSQSGAPWGVSVTTWAGSTLGAISNYGTSPGAVLVPAVNAFITNIPAVSQSGTWTVQQGGAPWSVTTAGSTTPADTFANPTNAQLDFSLLSLWNGTTWDRWPGDKTNGAKVNITNASLAVTQSGAWTVTANAGTNLNTSLLALESGGHLANVDTNTTGLNNTVGTPGAAVPSKNQQMGTKDTAGNSQDAKSDSQGRLFGLPYPDTTTASYHASAKIAASSTTDNAVIPGNASNTVLLTRVTVTCTETTAGIVNVEIVKRSTADTAGTSAGMTEVPDDSNYSAASSALLTYTGTGPTVGTAVGDLDNAQIGCNASSTAGPNDIYIFRPAKPIVLRGTAQMVAINLGGAITGGNITVTFDWMETTTP